MQTVHIESQHVGGIPPVAQARQSLVPNPTQSLQSADWHVLQVLAETQSIRELQELLQAWHAVPVQN